tara:strand:- start:344 stop:859 length:516 start_codon:yes stop_codon:yes gene_type:complete
MPTTTHAATTPSTRTADTIQLLHQADAVRDEAKSAIKAANNARCQAAAAASAKAAQAADDAAQVFRVEKARWLEFQRSDKRKHGRLQYSKLKMMPRDMERCDELMQEYERRKAVYSRHARQYLPTTSATSSPGTLRLKRGCAKQLRVDTVHLPVTCIRKHRARSTTPVSVA